MAVVYLIHLERPLSKLHTARHYLGSAEDLEGRVRLHRASQGSRFLAVANERSIGWEVVRTWTSDDARGRFATSQSLEKRAEIVSALRADEKDSTFDSLE